MSFKHIRPIDMDADLARKIEAFAGIAQTDPWENAPDKERVINATMRASHEPLFSAIVEIPDQQTPVSPEATALTVTPRREHIRDRNSRIPYSILADIKKGF